MKREKLKDFFHISSTQKRGFFVLGLILILVIMAPAFYKAFLLKPTTIDFENDRREIEAFISKMEFQHSEDDSEYNNRIIDLDNTEYSSAKAKLNPFPFNPNNLPFEKWIEMGFTEKQVKSIKNYEQKGGRFYSKQDVKKIWVISPEEYHVIEPFIQLPDSLSGRQKREYQQREPKTYQIVELNAADTSMLKTLPGIGSAFASRIFKYKLSLGGFHSKYQLMEVHGMDSARFAGIEPYIDVNPWLVRRININTADFDTFRSHPYISNNVAISLINYRNRHGDFVNIEDIMKSELVDEQLFRKLAPYLKTG